MAQPAFALRREVHDIGRADEVAVFHGVYNIRNHQISMPVDLFAPPTVENVRLALAPDNPEAFATLADRMVELLRPLLTDEA